MRTVREISDKEENFRTEPIKENCVYQAVRRDPVKAEPEGTIVVMAFRLTGYSPDCDGSLMGKFDNIHFDDPDETTGWSPDCLGLSSGTCLVFTEDELKELHKKASSNK